VAGCAEPLVALVLLVRLIVLVLMLWTLSRKLGVVQ
jgi:hypothetical protein